MIDCQAWYGSLLRGQNCFVIVAAVFYMDRRFRGFTGLGNWYEEVIDGFPFFDGWLHGWEKRCKITPRCSLIFMLFFHSVLHQALSSLLNLAKSEDVIRVMQVYLRVANIDSEDQPYIPALKTWHYRCFQLLSSHPIATSSWSLHDIQHGSGVCVTPTAIWHNYGLKVPHRCKECRQIHGPAALQRDVLPRCKARIN